MIWMEAHPDMIQKDLQSEINSMFSMNYYLRQMVRLVSN